MRVLCIIPARGGSKRVPGKNIRPLGGRPLVQWSIEAVKGLDEICDILVSTDDQAVADVSIQSGAMVPWMRPAELSSDTAKSVDVAIHALDWYENKHGKVDGLLLLQPTSPFRSQSTIRRGVALFAEHRAQPVIGVSPASTHPLWSFRIAEGKLEPFIDGSGLQTRSQDLPPAYEVNGAFYLMSPGELIERHSFYGDDMIPLIMQDPRESLDIDTEWDWIIAEAILQHKCMTWASRCG